MSHTKATGDRKSGQAYNTDYYIKSNVEGTHAADTQEYTGALDLSSTTAYDKSWGKASVMVPIKNAQGVITGYNETFATIDKFWKNDTDLTVLRTRNGDHLTTGARTMYPGHTLIVTANTTLTIKANNINVCPGAKIVVEPGAKLLIKGGNTKGDFGRLNLLGELINYGEIENQCKFVLHRGSEFINAANGEGASGNFIMKKGGVSTSSQAEPEMLEVMNSLGNRYHTDMGQDSFFWSLSKTVPIAGGDGVQRQLEHANDETTENVAAPVTEGDVAA